MIYVGRLNPQILCTVNALISAHGRLLFLINLAWALIRDYTKSTNEDQLSSLDISKRKQLLYVPLHKAYASLIYSRGNTKIILNQSYNGSVLTSYSATGDKYLDEFLLTDLSYSQKITSSPIYLSIKIKNLFDSSYQNYSNYPNPGREYILTLNYKLN